MVQGIRDSLRDAGRRRDPQTSRPDPAEPHAISAGEEGEIEEVASKPPAERRSWQVADVSRQGAEIPGVIGEALQLERQGPQGMGTRRNPGSRERLDRLRVRQRMAHGRIARHCLDRVNRSLVRPAFEGTLDSPVLVPK